MIVVIDLDRKVSETYPDSPATVDGISDVLLSLKNKSEYNGTRLALTNLHKSKDLIILGLERDRYV